MTSGPAETKSGVKLSSMQFPIRWGEMDALGHVNNASYLRYFEESRILWGESLGMHLDGTGEGMILLKASVTYKTQVSYPASIQIDLFAGDIGRTSFQLVNTLTVAGESKPEPTGSESQLFFVNSIINNFLLSKSKPNGDTRLPVITAISSLNRSSPSTRPVFAAVLIETAQPYCFA